MKRIAAILALALCVGGCVWKPWEKKNQPILPDEESATAPPAEEPVQTASAPASSPAPPTPPAVAPVPRRTYRVVRGSEIVEAAMIQVNDKYITLQQVLHPIREKLRSAAGECGEKEFRRRAGEWIAEEVRNQVEQTLVSAEAESRLEEREKDAIERQVERRYRQALAEANGSKTRLGERLRQEGTDVESWRDDIRRGLVVRTYLQRHVFSRIYVTRQMMWAYYRAHPEEFRSRGRVQMQVISVPFRAFLPAGDAAATEADGLSARTRARERIDQAAAALAKGGDFAEVARKFSSGPKASAGGVWPMMDVGSFRATQVELVAYRQNVGQVSRPVETRDGFYLVKTLACDPGEDLPFEDVQSRIEDTLNRQQYATHVRAYLEKLRGKATIVMAEKFRQLSADAAVSLFYKR